MKFKAGDRIAINDILSAITGTYVEPYSETMSYIHFDNPNFVGIWKTSELVLVQRIERVPCFFD